jgi:3-oxoacyl-[acyl-carrier protein] reductase
MQLKEPSIMEAERELVASSKPRQVFKDWNVVVMGGSRGIGHAVALGFAEQGAKVAVCARRQDALDTLARDVGQIGQTAYVATCDVGDAVAVSTFISNAAAALGGVDVLVNCASAMAAGSDDSVWSASFNIDLLGSVHATNAALSFLKGSAQASIVNMASIAALKAVPVRPAYGAIKAAVMHQTASSALALAADGIRVNCVVPGSTESSEGIWERIAQTNPGLYQDTRASIPLGRFARPEDIAKVVLFLASSDAAWITGQNIVVDGGQSLVRPGA